ncbi:MAG: GWxTD domain-containing protein [Bryobacteraceae bacterium]
MKAGLILFLMLAAAANGDWLASVQPVITAPERELFLKLPDDAAREKFQEEFWRTRSVTAEEYYRRLAIVDQTFGSSKLLSGTRTDQGRVYLTLGPPSSTTRLASSRVFFPLEVWYYDGLKAEGIPAHISLIFFRHNGSSDYKLYSPEVDTIRALLNPQTSTRGIFPKNDIITAGDLRERLELSPSETEVADAALHVAIGITGSGNDAIIGRVLSPQAVLNRPVQAAVSSRVFAYSSRPQIRTFQSAGEGGAVVVDMEVTAAAQNKVSLQVKQNLARIVETTSRLDLASSQRIRYRHRLHLLPGEYTLELEIDGQAMPHRLTVTARQNASEILVGSAVAESRQTPFQFGTLNVAPASRPNMVMVQTGAETKVRWMLRRGNIVVWTATGPAGQPLPAGLPAGRYSLSAEGEDWRRATEFEVAAEEDSAQIVSYNANLAPEQVWNSIGRQQLMRGAFDKAAACFQLAGTSDETILNIARLKALRGDLDGSREMVAPILKRQPDQFEALALMGYVKAQLQDYRIAADFYRRALQVRKSPEVENALTAVTQQMR